MTAAERVLAVEPPDDSGAQTADRYDWQAAMAAADGLALYLRALDEDGRLPADQECRVLCEWQEDWVLVDGDDAELVSGKHRDPEVGAFTTMNGLADQGGLAHLFNRWAALDELASCRLVTTAGLAAGDPQNLEAACAHFRRLRTTGADLLVGEGQLEIVTKLRKAVVKYCDTTRARWSGDHPTPMSINTQDAEVARFLSALRIDHGRPQRAHIGYAAPGMYAQPVLDRLGLIGPAVAAWEAVVMLFRARMRARGPAPAAALPTILGGTANGVNVAPDLQERTVTLTDIEAAVRIAMAMPVGYRPVRQVPVATRLGMKMISGGCSDNAIERAEHLSLEYRQYWRERVAMNTSGHAERSRLERALLRVTDDATSNSASRRSSWQRIQEGIDGLPTPSLPPGMDHELALGGVCDLASQCKVWFSPRFDVDAALAELSVERSADS